MTFKEFYLCIRTYIYIYGTYAYIYTHIHTRVITCVFFMEISLDVRSRAGIQLGRPRLYSGIGQQSRPTEQHLLLK